MIELDPRHDELIEAFMHNEASLVQLQELADLVSSDSAVARQIALKLAVNSMIVGRLRAEADDTFVAESVAAIEKRTGDTKFVRTIMDKVFEASPVVERDLERSKTTRNHSPVRHSDRVRTHSTSECVTKPKAFRPHWAGWAAGVGLASAFVLYLFGRVLFSFSVNLPAIATVISGSTKGYIFRDRDRYPLSDNSGISDGDIVQSGTGLQFHYNSDPGTKITLAPDTKIRLAFENGAKRLVLLSGKIEAEVSPQAPGQAMILTTVHAEVKVVGTRFTLQEDPSFTKVEVQEGKVRMTRRLDGAAVDVPVGHAASADSAISTPMAVSSIDAIEQGLIARWRLDEGKGQTAQSESGTLAVVSGAQWVPGKDGSALALNGVSDHVDLGGSSALNFAAGTPFTYAGWFKTTTGFGMLVSHRHTNEEGPVIDIGIGRNGSSTIEGRLMALIRPNGPMVHPYCQVVGGQVNDNAWHHFAVTRQPDGTLGLYLDGVLQNSARTPASSGPINTNRRVLGYEHYWKQIRTISATYFSGSIDDIRIYDRALNPAEIQKLASGK